MGQAIPTQHPAVVLRSHYNHLRALLVVATIAVVGLATAVVILANDEDRAPSVSTATPVVVQPNSGERYDGGPEEGTRDIASAPAPVSRYDGGPEEGTRDISSAPAPVSRYDGGPEEGTRDIAPARAPVSRYDGGPEEGTAARAQNPRLRFLPRLSGHPLRRRPRGGHHRSGSLTQPGRSTCVPRRPPRRGTWCVRGSSRRVRTRDHGSDEGGTGHSERRQRPRRHLPRVAPRRDAVATRAAL